MSDSQIAMLLERARNGHGPALELLLTRFRDRIARIVHIWSGARSTPTIDWPAVMARTLAVAGQQLPATSIDGEATLLRWLATLAKDSVERVPGAVAATPTSGGSRRRDDGAERVDSAISALAPADRDLLVGRYLLGLSWSEIARELGSDSLAVLRQRVAVAKARLAMQLQRMAPRH